MSRQDANSAFALTSFLYSGNADYIDKLYARYEADPQAVDAQWQLFFAGLKDAARDVVQNARGPSWQRSDWPPAPHGDLISAFDSDWGEVEKSIGDKVLATARAKGVEVSAGAVQQAARDSVKALMLIRAYRARGHLHANLDPLGLEPVKDAQELDPGTYGFTDADYDRKIFLDRVLGLEFGTLRQIMAILQRTYCQTLGVELCISLIPSRRAGFKNASKDPTRRSPSPARASGRSSTSWLRPKGSRSSATSNSPAPSGLGWTAQKQ